jgi:hypothetical protein
MRASCQESYIDTIFASGIDGLLSPLIYHGIIRGFSVEENISLSGYAIKSDKQKQKLFSNQDVLL